METLDEINDLTGFANGNKFNNKRDIFLYFTVENMKIMFGEHSSTQIELDTMANIVIDNKWHMREPIF